MREIGSGYWQAIVRTGSTPAEPFADFLEDGSLGISLFEYPHPQTGEIGWQVTAIYRTQPDAAALGTQLALVAAANGLPEPVLEILPLPPADWLAEAYAGFPPQRIGRFFVHGSHVEPPKAGTLPLLIDAATAFGSGEHDTTRLCLTALERLRRQGRIANPLDLGCGSGILSLAAALLWRVPVLGSDLDPESVRVARANARLNRLAGLVHVVEGDGYRAPAIAKRRPFDLIVANILARPLCRLAPTLARHLAPGGVAILSGLLIEQEAQVLAAHRSQGLALTMRLRSKAWSALVVRRRSA